VLPIGAASATPAATVSYRLDTVASVDRPTDIASRPGDQAIYVTEQDGRVLRITNTSSTGRARRSTALDLRPRTGADGERGLLGIVFHPNGKFLYVNYTDNDGDTVVARYAVRPDGKAVASSRTVLFTLDQPYANHNGGGLSFGPDGRLFVATGDGGSAGDPERVALDRSSLLGKIVSLDPDADGTATNDARIWSVGLRTPWRFEFDDENNLWVADVGQNEWEEVNVVWAADGSGDGANFGWSAYEGKKRYNKDQNVTRHTRPVYVYAHGDAGCSISGGTKVRSARLPALRGWYLFGDYCSGDITALRVEGSRTTKTKKLFDDVGSVTAVRSVSSGDVYVLTHGGDVKRLSVVRP
jgi:glucose/arabinose dehydrogenase